MFAMLGARLVYVQAVLRTDLEQKADRQLRTTATDRVRGPILDRNGRLLAETIQVSSCFVDPTHLQDRAATAHTLGTLLNLSPQSLLNEWARSKSEFVWVKRNLPGPIVDQIKEKDLPGVAFKKEWRRNYPASTLAPHLLGLVGVDGQGLSGTELLYDKVLRGSDTAQPGSVQLSIDAQIQAAVEKELEWGAQKTKAKKAMAIVQDPTTGEILALASWPPISLDPEHPSKADDMRIPPIVDVFEPGSTFKVVTAAAAIEEHLLKPKELFNGENGKWKLKTITIHDHEPRKWMTFDDIFIYSSNIGAAKIGERLGADRLFQYSRLFGFGVFPGSGLPGEAKGVLRNLKKWSGVSKYCVSFGQEVGVTALQVVDAYSAIANGGQLLEPRFFKSITSETNQAKKEFAPTVVRRVMSTSTSKRLTEILSEVVEEGTGQFAQVQWRKDLKIAGKTGTAQKFNRSQGKYDENVNLVSFAGFFPVESPKYTMIVILDEPEGKRWGGLDAAPIFRRIAEQLIAPPGVS